ncbi:MAG TPA: hypothetical protein VNH53_02680 [Sphingomicrobium sp.]|jgi:hypothetical protein|nr:hypothetical protein [Sphingomicrobium sp.]
MDYSDRELIDVIVSDMRSWVDRNGDTLISGEVTVTLNNVANPEIAGPHIKARVGLPSVGSASLEEIEIRFLEATRALLRRLADEPVENLQQAYSRERDERMRPDPLSELHESLRTSD